MEPDPTRSAAGLFWDVALRRARSTPSRPPLPLPTDTTPQAHWPARPASNDAYLGRDRCSFRLHTGAGNDAGGESE